MIFIDAWYQLNPRTVRFDGIRRVMHPPVLQLWRRRPEEFCINCQFNWSVAHLLREQNAGMNERLEEQFSGSRLPQKIAPERLARLSRNDASLMQSQTPLF